MVKLVIVGGGRMGEALLAGLLDAGWAAPGELAVVEPVERTPSRARCAFPRPESVAEAGRRRRARCWR